MKKSFLYLLFFLSFIFFVACKDEIKDDIGASDPIKWKTDFQMSEKHIAAISADGGTYVLTAKNYKIVTIDYVTEVCESEGISRVFNLEYGEDGKTPDYFNLKTTWSSVNINDNVVTVKISPNQSSSRDIRVDLSCGNAFDVIVFKQDSGKH